MKHTFSPGSIEKHVAERDVVDVSSQASQHGLWGTVLLSRAVWDKCVRVPQSLAALDTISDRLSAILASLAKRETSSIFGVWVLIRPDGASVVVLLKASYTVFESGPPAIHVDFPK